MVYVHIRMYKHYCRASLVSPPEISLYTAVPLLVNILTRMLKDVGMNHRNSVHHLGKGRER